MGVSMKNQNTPRPSEHPPVMVSKVLIHSCKDVDVILGNCTKLFVTKDQLPPTSNIPSGHKNV